MQKVTTAELSKGIALYGGAFDPVHCAHLTIAELALQSGLVEEVVFIPAAQSPLKRHGPIASDRERLSMLELATANTPKLRVDDYELNKGGMSYSVQTAQHFRERYPQARLFWVVGADQFEQLDRWRSIEELCQLVEFLVFARPGSSLERPEMGERLRYQVLDAPLMPQSSTEIRHRLTAGESLEEWLPEAVEAFISQHGVYKQPLF
ncbi:MAG: nicotinate (nicotinamide) nucleotide adenylyltransferase [Coraliomargarita sp.]